MKNAFKLNVTITKYTAEKLFRIDRIDRIGRIGRIDRIDRIGRIGRIKGYTRRKEREVINKIDGTGTTHWDPHIYHIIIF